MQQHAQRRAPNWQNSHRERSCGRRGRLRAHLDDDVGRLLLGVDVGVEVGLARLDGGLDGLQRVAALLHVALDLPGELDLVADVQVDLEVQQVGHALVVEGVQPLQHHDLQHSAAQRSTAGQGPWADLIPPALRCGDAHHTRACLLARGCIPGLIPSPGGSASSIFPCTMLTPGCAYQWHCSKSSMFVVLPLILTLCI